MSYTLRKKRQKWKEHMLLWWQETQEATNTCAIFRLCSLPINSTLAHLDMFRFLTYPVFLSFPFWLYCRNLRSTQSFTCIVIYKWSSPQQGYCVQGWSSRPYSEQMDHRSASFIIGSVHQRIHSRFTIGMFDLGRGRPQGACLWRVHCVPGPYWSPFPAVTHGTDRQLSPAHLPTMMHCLLRPRQGGMSPCTGMSVLFLFLGTRDWAGGSKHAPGGKLSTTELYPCLPSAGHARYFVTVRKAD